MTEEKIHRQLVALRRIYPKMKWKIATLSDTGKGYAAVLRTCVVDEVGFVVRTTEGGRWEALAVDGNRQLLSGTPKIVASNTLDAVDQMGRALLRCAHALAFMVDHEGKDGGDESV